MNNKKPKNKTNGIPRYQCQMIVRAIKIARIEYDIDKAKQNCRETDWSATLIPVEKDILPIKVSYEYVRKYNPQIGDYYILDNGFCPQSIFAKNYVRI